MRQLLYTWMMLQPAGVLRAEAGVQQRGVGTEREAEAGPERRLHVLHCDPVTGLPIPHQNRDGDPVARQQRLQAALSASSLHLVAVVLEPDLHLVRGETDQPGQVLPLRGRQVPLLPEATLQLEGLRLGEQHTPLSTATLLRFAARSVALCLRGLV